MPTKVTRAADAISCISPTMGRPDKHASLYETFASQAYPNKELLVLDESAAPSPFFSSLHDERVRYWHEPGAPRIGGVTRIGSARNKLYARAHGPIVSWFDDDDRYSSSYLSRMREYLGDADVAKLTNWLSHHEKTGTMWQWKTQFVGGRHFAMKGSENPVPVDIPPGGDGLDIDWMVYGFGFSYVTRKDLWERVPFNEEGTEDYPWMKKCIALGAQVVLVDDYPEGVIHAVHDRSESVLWPQTYLGTRAMIGARPSLRASMIGSMTELPKGQSIHAVPGVEYKLLASVKKTHSLHDLSIRAANHGVIVLEARDNVPASEFQEKAPGDDYRLVLIRAKTSQPYTLPWQAPKWLVWDKTRCVRVWTSAPAPMVGTLRAMP